MADNTTQGRKWLLTINNPSEHCFSHDAIAEILGKFKNLDYWCMCDEVGQSETYHTHVFIYRSNPIRFSALKNKFPVAHIDFAVVPALKIVLMC